MNKLDFGLDREVVMRAPREIVFRYFTDSARFARWWGAGSTIEGRVGGAIRIVMPGNVEARGEVLELAPSQRIVFTFGFASGQPIPLGGSRVTVTLADHPLGTLLTLHHDFADAMARDQFVQGWRYQLAVFANNVADEAFAASAARADAWFAAWNESDAAKRRALLASCAIEQVAFADRFSCTLGAGDLDAHIAAAKVHMPGIVIARSGEPRQCQGTALVDWSCTGPDGKPMGRGTNSFEFAPDGRIARAVGFWAS